MRRTHDDVLDDLVDAAVAGKSTVVTLVGESSTGKTRAAFEAVRRLDERWRVWHPISPSRPEALLAGLAAVSPRTVVWLNEAQHYLLTTPPALGERAAAGLRELVRDPARAPVLVLATLWPQHWRDLVAPSPFDGRPDTYGQARTLLGTSRLAVPPAFLEGDEEALRRMASRDPRLAYALEQSRDGRVTQFLAGALALVDRHVHAPASARAVVDAAMDARRLGHGPELAHSFLEAAAPGYVGDADRVSAPPDWFENALAHLREPVQGGDAILSGVPAPTGMGAKQGVVRLADSLEEQARRERRGFPPASFWDATLDQCNDAASCALLADSAADRMRYRYADRLYRRALDRGDERSWKKLVLLHTRMGNHREAEALVRRAQERGVPDAVPMSMILVQARFWEGDDKGADEWVMFAAAHGGATAIRLLAREYESEGAVRRAEELYEHAAEAGDIPAWVHLIALRERRKDPHGVDRCVRAVIAAGNSEAASALAQHWEDTGQTSKTDLLSPHLTDVATLVEIAVGRERREDRPGARRFRDMAAALAETIGLRYPAVTVEHEVRLADVDVLGSAARTSDGRGDTGRADQLALQALRAGSTQVVRLLVRTRVAAGDDALAERLAMTVAEQGNTSGLEILAREWARAGRIEDAERVYELMLNRGALHVRRPLTRLAELRGDPQQAERVARLAAIDKDYTALLALAAMRRQEGRSDEYTRLLGLASAAGSSTGAVALVRFHEASGNSAEAERVALHAAASGQSAGTQELGMLRREGRRSTDFSKAALEAAATDASAAEAPDFPRGGVLAAPKLHGWTAHIGEAHLGERLLDGQGTRAENLHLMRQIADLGGAAHLADWLSEADDRTRYELVRYGLEANGDIASSWW